MAAVENARGGYIYLPAGFPFSSGAAAMAGYEVVQAVFRRPVPWRDGFDAMAKLCLVTGTIVLYAYLTEFFMAWYSGEDIERQAFWNRFFGPYWWAGWTMLTCNTMIPILLWFKRVRHSIAALFVISIFINIGMWFERFVIIVTSLSHEFMPFAWGTYRPSMTEMGIVIGSFAWFGFWFLLFIRIFPPVAISELKEVLPTPLSRSAREEAAR